MSFSATTYKITEELLAAMLAANDSWRAICAAPTALFSEIAATIEAGSVPAGDAESRILFGLFNDELGEDEKQPPRICIANMEGEVWTRQGGFTMAGELYVEIQLPIPASLKNDPGGAIRDGRKKVDAIAIDLGQTQPQNGYLKVTGIESAVVGLSRRTEVRKGQRLVIGDITVRHDGGL